MHMPFFSTLFISVTLLRSYILRNTFLLFSSPSQVCTGIMLIESIKILIKNLLGDIFLFYYSNVYHEGKANLLRPNNKK